MLEDMVTYHWFMVLILFIFLIIGVFIPFLYRDSTKIIRLKRIYMFIIHAIITGVAFGGLVTFIFAKITFSISIALMILAYILLSAIESIKYIKILKLKSIQTIRDINIKYTLISIVIVLLFIIWK